MPCLSIHILFQLDGQIARRWPSQASKAGSFLDPMADKLLMGSLVISLCYSELMPMWLTGVVVFRDLFLIAAGFVIRYISLPPPVSIYIYYYSVIYKNETIYFSFAENVFTLF